MRRLPLLIVSGSLITASFVACRSSGDDTVTPDTPLGGDKIQDVQNDSMAPGTPVTLNGVVVTAVDTFGAKLGDLWVEEPEGGPYSGIHVFTKGMDTGVMVGDIVNISGAQKSEFALSGSGGDMTGRTVTELEPVTGGAISVTKTGTGTVPAPAVVDALAIGKMYDASMQTAGGGAAFTNAWEQWEGVLITVANVSAVSGPKGFGSTPYAADAYAFNITGVAKVEGTQTDITMASIVRGSCLGSVTGVVDYFFDYLILPRSAADLGGPGATGCPALETTCTDTTDNDGNGYADCKDNNCIVNDATCAPPVTTINAIQTAGTPPTGPIEIQGAYVMAVSYNKKNMWISTAAGAASNNGIYVFGDGTDYSQFAVGSKVNVFGSVTEFNDMSGTGTMTEVNAIGVTAASGTGTPAASTCGGSCLASSLTVDANGEPYESVMVTLANVKVTVSANMTNHYISTLAQVGGTIFEGISDIFTIPAADLNKCYTSMTGFWSYDVFANKWGLQVVTVGAEDPTVSHCN